MRAWTLALETGDLKAADAFGGNYDRWIRHVEEVTGPMVQDISRVCIVAGVGLHVDPSTPRCRAEDQSRVDARMRGQQRRYRQLKVVRPLMPRGMA